MTKNLFAPDNKTIEALLAQAWTLAREKYDDADARRFMENPHKATLNTADTEYEFSSPEDIIRAEGQRGFDLVKAALS